MTRPLLSFAILCALSGPLFSADRPNIVLIMADDMKTDRTEINNLAAEKPKLVKELDARWWKWAERCRVLPMNPNHKGEFLKRKQEALKRKKQREAEAKQRAANPGS